MTCPIESPQWWRGTTPEQLPADGSLLVRGSVETFDSQEVPRGRSGLRSVFFQQATVTGVVVDLDEMSFHSAWSEFSNCTFKQGSGKLVNGAAAQGSFGSRPSVYRDCEFLGVRFGSPGRFSTGSALFERCRFLRCRFNAHFSFATDYVDCVFTGKIDGAVWYGTDTRAEHGRRNLIRGNDFTDAVLSNNVGWRGDFDTAAQRWPVGYQPT